MPARVVAAVFVHFGEQEKMSDVQKACESIVAEANELWVEMGLNAEECEERRARFSSMIRQSLKDLLQKVCESFSSVLHHCFVFFLTGVFAG